MWPTSDQSIETDSEMTEVMELSEKDFKIIVLNMLKSA